MAAVLLAAVFLAYYPAWHGGLIWDDDKHITLPELRSWHGLWRIWFDVGAAQQYYPLVHTAFWIQHRLWGDATLGYHLVNILLHAVSAVMVALILRRLAIPGAWLAAAVFALHPVHVESVAWITEMKNTLSAVFYLGAMRAYLGFDRGRQVSGIRVQGSGFRSEERETEASRSFRNPDPLREGPEFSPEQSGHDDALSFLNPEPRTLTPKFYYGLSLALFVLGLLSKTVTATLPGALLVIFWWQRGRLSWKTDVVPLLPFFVLGAAAGVFTAWVERTYIGAQGAEFEFTLVERCLIAGRAIWFYLGKLFWPSELLFIYPRWQISAGAVWQYVFPAAALVLVTALWAMRRRWRGPLAGVLFFAGTLFPVLGFFNVYPFVYSFVADHFQYLASLGILTLASGGVAVLMERRGVWGRPVGLALCLGLLLVLGCLTWRQCGIYTDIETLWRDTLRKDPDCWMAHNNLASALTVRGRIEEAIPHFQRGLKINPDSAEARNAFGLVLAGRGQYEEAIVHYRKAVDIQPRFAEAHNNLGNALLVRGQAEEAIAHYRKALEINPDYALPHNNLGNALMARGRTEAAIAHYRRALEINPAYAKAHNNIGVALARSGRGDEAVAHYRKALEIDPDYVDARTNLDIERGKRMLKTE